MRFLSYVNVLPEIAVVQRQHLRRLRKACSLITFVQGFALSALTSKWPLVLGEKRDNVECVWVRWLVWTVNGNCRNPRCLYGLAGVHGKALSSLHCQVLSAQILVAKLPVFFFFQLSVVHWKKECLLNSAYMPGSDSPVNKIKTEFTVKCVLLDVTFRQYREFRCGSFRILCFTGRVALRFGRNCTICFMIVVKCRVVTSMKICNYNSPSVQ